MMIHYVLHDASGRIKQSGFVDDSTVSLLLSMHGPEDCFLALPAALPYLADGTEFYVLNGQIAQRSSTNQGE